jgi:hypothetical protein
LPNTPFTPASIIDESAANFASAEFKIHQKREKFVRTVKNFSLDEDKCTIKGEAHSTL